MTDQPPSIIVITEREWSRGVHDRIRQYHHPDRPPTRTERILHSIGWLHCCSRCGCHASHHWTPDGGYGPCEFNGHARHARCPQMRHRVVRHANPTPHQVLRYIDRILDITEKTP